jgi:hypothetical protein
MPTKEPQRYVSAESMTADDFGTAFTNKEGELVYDAATKQGPWATMTHENFLKYGRGKLGLGLGQKYQRQANGQLHKIGG